MKSLFWLLILFLLLFHTNPMWAHEVIKSFDWGTTQLHYHVNDAEQKHGGYREWNRDGKLILSTGYQNDKEHGLRQVYTRDGELEEVSHYRNGLRHGPYQSYFFNSKLIQEIGNFTDDQRDGKWEKYFDNGKPARKILYRKGLILADETFHRNGLLYIKSLHEETDSHRDEERLTSRRTYNVDGKLIKSEAFSKGKLHGKFIQNTEEGKPRIEEEYRDGLLHGPAKKFYENGKVSEVFTYHKGAKHGEYVEYFPTGIVRAKGSYKNGVLAGRFRSFHENSQLAETGYYKGGLKSERFTEYYMNGKRKIRAHYKSGKRHGEYKVFYPDERLFYVVNYKNGKEDGAATLYSSDGAILEETQFNNGQIVVYRSYDVNGGKVERKSFWVDGSPILQEDI